MVAITFVSPSVWRWRNSKLRIHAKSSASHASIQVCARLDRSNMQHFDRRVTCRPEQHRLQHVPPSCCEPWQRWCGNSNSTVARWEHGKSGCCQHEFGLQAGCSRGCGCDHCRRYCCTRGACCRVCAASTQCGRVVSARLQRRVASVGAAIR